MPHTNLSYAFGPYRLSPAERVLLRAGEIVALSLKATEILIVLVTNAGKVVEKDDLLREVWPNSFVEDANLSQNIFILRRALGDERDSPRYIETVTRRGYRFIAHVRPCNSDQPLALEVAADGSQPAVGGDESVAKPVVAVLPLLNSTGDPGMEYLAEGLTDNLIHTLSRVSQLRVMSRSAVFRRSSTHRDPQFMGAELGATAVLVGAITARGTGTVISVELVDVATGWQLWGESFDCQVIDILQIQETITRQILASLKLTLTGEEEKQITARYTESAAAYQAYLEGRYHWSNYTRTGIEIAIGHFRQAIELDPNYALAYAAIVDCYLRLATNYLPPEDNLPRSMSETAEDQLEARIKLRFTWDWKGVERELRRATELKTDYPAAHQWYAAYCLSQEIYEGIRRSPSTGETSSKKQPRLRLAATQVTALEPTPSEQIQIYCAVAREQIEAGNYDAACRVLQSWWRFDEWPRIEGLSDRSCADLLFTVGELAGCEASTKQLPKGQKHGEALLNGSIAIFEQLGSNRRAAEARIELALCYYRQGLFELGRSTLLRVLDALSADDSELRSLALIRLASLERHAGHLNNALALLDQARVLVESSGPWVSGRRHLELASTYKDIAKSDERPSSHQKAEEFYLRALHEFEAVGNHRLCAIVENNLGLLLLITNDFAQAELHLLKARRMFEHLDDRIRCAQADDSLARLYFEQGRLIEAQMATDRSVQTMETGDEDALLAESLTTKGVIYSALRRYNEAQKALDGAYRLASRCGDTEGAGRSLLVMVEEMASMLELEELHRIRTRLIDLLSTSEQASIRTRATRCIQIINSL